MRRWFAFGRRHLSLGSHYDSSVVEQHWKTQTWPPPPSRSQSSVFSMVVPPPNVTGSLHLGHALTVAMQDAMIRRNRQQGRDAVWVPGLDHAGIATQVVVEKRLAPVSRHQIGREKFVEHVWQWKKEKEKDILAQMRRMGLAFDWSRFTFTLDPHYAKAVTELFCRLYEKGLIYRAARGVNWCPKLQSVISDIEIEMIEQPGVLHLVDYGNGIAVATTRPETIYADVAVAVHPSDPRFVGITDCINPLTGKRIPIVRDSILVDPLFGTGAVKITPAHSFEDRECGERHNLPLNERAFDDKGLMLEDTHFAGKDRIEVRSDVVRKLQQSGKYLGFKDHPNMRVPTCSRSGDVLEPSWKSQWYVDCSKMSARALSYCDEIIPEKYRGEWIRFLGESRDWCVSRQLWWGHRVPAYLVNGEWVVSREPPAVFERQDDDVLDTWFSSALFPLASFGWPDKLDKRYYPLSVMETGADILFFWVARMAMICSEMEPDLGCPFGRVVLHPMVRDKFGRKMSKSVGNVIDPMNLIEGQTLADMLAAAEVNTSKLSDRELSLSMQYLKKEFPEGLPKCGADAVRFALVDSEGGESVNVDVALVVEANHMCNKIWNAAKFVHSKPRVSFPSGAKLGAADVWLQGLMLQTSQRVAAAFAADKLYRATKELKSFLLLFCSHYIEHSKLEDTPVSHHFLHLALDFFLIQLHPFMPFLTDYLRESDTSVAVIPEMHGDAQALMEPYEHVIALVSVIRSLKTRRKQPFRVLLGRSGSADVDRVLEESLPIMRRMCKLEHIVMSWEIAPGDCLTLPVLGKLSVEVWPKHEDGDDMALRNKLSKLEEKLARLESKWSEERASEEARLRHHKTKQVLMQQISDLKRTMN